MLKRNIIITPGPHRAGYMVEDEASTQNQLTVVEPSFIFHFSMKYMFRNCSINILAKRVAAVIPKPETNCPQNA